MVLTMTYLDIILGITVFYVIRYYLDKEYNKKIRFIIIDILIASGIIAIIKLVIFNLQ